VAIHPFPNGNGRHARLMADLLVMQLGGERFSWGRANLRDAGTMRAQYITALIQAIERSSGYVETDSGTIVRALKSTYKRHGTLNLFAALEVGTGQVHTKFTDYKKREDFQSFLDGVLADQPQDKEIHVILDNYSTHKRNDDWLAKFEGRVQFHFTPTSASWLNQIEIVFSLLQRKTLSGASFKTKDQLRELAGCGKSRSWGLVL
jgi:transposase